MEDLVDVEEVRQRERRRFNFQEAEGRKHRTVRAACKKMFHCTRCDIKSLYDTVLGVCRHRWKEKFTGGTTCNVLLMWEGCEMRRCAGWASENILGRRSRHVCMSEIRGFLISSEDRSREIQVRKEWKMARKRECMCKGGVHRSLGANFKVSVTCMMKAR